MRKLIAGNWKMNGTMASGRQLTEELVAGAGPPGAPGCHLLICPPAQLLVPLGAMIEGSGIMLGAQDCHTERSGAHTGDIAAEMLAEVGCSHVIVGHSERRANHGESDQVVHAKAEAARAVGLIPIICIGESADEREAGEALAVIERQLTGSLIRETVPQIVAYEPVWAIGTGKTATPEDVAEAHAHIRGLLNALLGQGGGSGVRILYGGSVKPANAGSLMAVPDVDGALVGGASLKAGDFLAIAMACP